MNNVIDNYRLGKKCMASLASNATLEEVKVAVSGLPVYDTDGTEYNGITAGLCDKHGRLCELAYYLYTINTYKKKPLLKESGGVGADMAALLVYAILADVIRGDRNTKLTVNERTVLLQEWVDVIKATISKEHAGKVAVEMEHLPVILERELELLHVVVERFRG